MLYIYLMYYASV